MRFDGKTLARFPRLSSTVLREKMKRLGAIVAIIIIIGCAGTRSNGLVGTWQTGVIESELGSSIITITYHDNGIVEGSIRFIGEDSGGGEMLQWYGTYTVDGDTILREVDNRVVKIKYEISGKSMRQVLGEETHLFKRK